MLRRRIIEKQKLGFINWVAQGKLATVEKLKADVPSASTSPEEIQSEWIRSDKGLTLETFFLYGGQFTLSTQLINPKFDII